MIIEVDIKDNYLPNFLDILNGLKPVIVNDYEYEDEKILQELENRIKLIKQNKIKTKKIEEFLNEL